MHRTVSYLSLLVSPLLLSACFIEVSGCSENVCFSAAESTCSSSECDHDIACEDEALIRQRMAEIISSARQQARSCGQNHFSSAGAVVWNAKLADAAIKHASDMARFNFFSHTGSDGSSVAIRVEDADYDYSLVAENIAAGQESSSKVISDWLSSPGHCSNMMLPNVREIGAACRQNSRSQYQTYWTLALAAP